MPPPSMSDSVTVTGVGGRVTIDRHPFRMAVSDPDGRVVLNEVANDRPAPRPIAGPSPGPLGATAGQSEPLYAPFTFTVGGQGAVTYPATPWAGNVLAGAVAGVQYSAGDVLDARPADHGIALTVATDDPTGRLLAVTVQAQGRHFVIDARLVGGAGEAALADAFRSDGAESFRGFGGRHDGLDQRGKSFYSWVEEENANAGSGQPVAASAPGSGGNQYLFPNGPSAAYYVQPQFISNHGYGLALQQSEMARWRLDVDRADAWTVGVAGPELRYVVAPGASQQAISELTGLSGRHPAPPGWAVGPQLDRLASYKDSPQQIEAHVREDIAAIDRFRIRLSAYRIEGWATLPEDHLRDLIGQLHQRGIRVLLYFRAFAGIDQAGTEQPAEFMDAVTRGYVATTAAGTPYVFGSPTVGNAALIDFTNPSAARWFAGRIDHGLDLGADGFMADFGEQVLPDMHFADGSTGTAMHNRYPVLYQQAVRHAVHDYEQAHPGRSIWWYNRAGYNGSAAYEAANFPGDETTDWTSSSGLASQTPDMLNRATGGAYGFTTDIGGYLDVNTPPTTSELFLRWAQWAALTPLFRIHGSAQAGTHTPWSYDPQTLHLYQDASRLHQAAQPLIDALWRQATQTGVPVTRPLWLAYPNDSAAAAQDQEWMLGQDVLVAPVVTEKARQRELYLPSGCWQYMPTGQTYAGGRTVTVDAPLSRLPYFFRCATHPFNPPA